MKIGLQGWGSEGDLRPVVALAAHLRRAGHQVRVDLTAVDGTDYVALGQRLEVPVRMLPEKMSFSLDQVARDADSANPMKVSRELLERSFFPHLELLYGAALELCGWADLVVWHYSSWYTLAAARKTGVPSVALHLFPGMVPTRTAAPPGFPSLGPLNLPLWWFARRVLDLQFLERPAKFFADAGLPPLRRVLPDLLFSETLNLHASSRVLLPPPPDWGPEHQVIGPLTLPVVDQPWSPSPELARFLADGPPPALFSLGSMEHLAPRRARELVVEGARRSGVRAIIQTKRDTREERDGALFFLPWAPHGALLPRCGLMVHHGGAGTSHAALRAGIPAVVVPFIFEQQIWADRLRAAGVSLRSVPFWKASADQLAARVRETAASEPLRARAQLLGQQVAEEDGGRRAVELIERLPLSA